MHKTPVNNNNNVYERHDPPLAPVVSLMSLESAL